MRRIMMSFELDPNTGRPWPHKWQRILAAFMDGHAWHTFDAMRELRSSCLHSDISLLEARGLRFNRNRIAVTGYGGAKTHVMAYQLAPESIPIARHLLGLAPDSCRSVDASRDYLRASRG
jgi:hypothetical protein